MATNKTPSRSAATDARRREQAARQRTAATVQLLNEHLDNIGTAADWGQALATTARLRRLTFANAIVAAAQRPNITDVRSYDEWIDAGRQVQKGEKGMRITVPVTTKVTGLAGLEGPPRIDGLDTTVIFDAAQTAPIEDPPGAGRSVSPPPATYSQAQIASVLGQTPAGASAPEETRQDATKLIQYHIGRGLGRLDASIAHEVGICAEHMVRSEIGMSTHEPQLGFIADWQHLPVAARRRRMIDVGNHAARTARSIIGVVHTRAVPDNIRPVDLSPATSTAQTAQTSMQEQAPAAWAMEATGADISDPSVLAAANADAWEYFRDLAAKSPVTTEYLAGRGIVATDELPVGYAPPDVRLGAHLRGLGYSDEVQIAAGLSRKRDDGHVVDVFRDRVLAAITDDAGRICGFTGRALTDQGPKYWNTSATELFNKSELFYGLTPPAKERLENGARPVLVEGPMDVLAIAQYQPDGLVALATCGTALTDQHQLVLEDVLPAQRVTIAYDTDTAGIDAAVRTGRRLSEQGWQVTCPPPRSGMDPADVAAATGSEVLTWLANARPAIYTAAEAGLAAARQADPAADKATIGARVIDQLETNWGNDNELKAAVGYVAMHCGLWRPTPATKAGQQTPAARAAVVTARAQQAAAPEPSPSKKRSTAVKPSALADTRQTAAWRTHRGGPGGVGRGIIR